MTKRDFFLNIKWEGKKQTLKSIQRKLILNLMTLCCVGRNFGRNIVCQFTVLGVVVFKDGIR
jgi:hypothetical protein